jgi:hypothetical protein
LFLFEKLIFDLIIIIIDFGHLLINIFVKKNGGVLVIVDVFVVVGVPEDIGTGVPQDDVTLIVDVEGVIDLDALFLGVAPPPVHALVTAQRVAELLLQTAVLQVLTDLRVESWRVLDLYVYFYF